MLNGKSILITGGTGSLGNALVKRILRDYSWILLGFFQDFTGSLRSSKDS